MAEAFTCWGCIIWRHKLIPPWKSQVSDTIRRRLIKPISHLNGLALPFSPSLFVFVPSIPLSRSFFVLIPIAPHFLLCRRFLSLSSCAVHFFPRLRFPQEISDRDLMKNQRCVDIFLVNTIQVRSTLTIMKNCVLKVYLLTTKHTFKNAFLFTIVIVLKLLLAIISKRKYSSSRIASTYSGKFY